MGWGTRASSLLGSATRRAYALFLRVARATSFLMLTKVVKLAKLWRQQATQSEEGGVSVLHSELRAHMWCQDEPPMRPGPPWARVQQPACGHSRATWATHLFCVCRSRPSSRCSSLSRPSAILSPNTPTQWRRKQWLRSHAHGRGRRWFVCGWGGEAEQAVRL